MCGLEQLDALCRLERRAHPGGGWSLEAMRQELEAPHSHVWGLWQGPVLSAMIAFWDTCGEIQITDVAVDPECRRRGLGRALVKALLTQARAQGRGQISLEVRASNDGAQALYAACGFAVAGRRPRYYQDNREDALVMTLHME